MRGSTVHVHLLQRTSLSRMFNSINLVHTHVFSHKQPTVHVYHTACHVHTRVLVHQ